MVTPAHAYARGISNETIKLLSKLPLKSLELYPGLRLETKSLGGLPFNTLEEVTIQIGLDYMPVYLVEWLTEKLETMNKEIQINLLRTDLFGRISEIKFLIIPKKEKPPKEEKPRKKERSLMEDVD